MSKVRIYELAKELGVDNRIIITLAQELGLSGKSSHSHSLESDEAEQIRRALLRRAMGARSGKAANGAAASPAETVTTRVDSSSGKTDTFLERRRGNVIMRRRQEGGPNASESNEGLADEVVEESSPNLMDSSDGAAIQPDSRLSSEEQEHFSSAGRIASERSSSESLDSTPSNVQSSTLNSHSSVTGSDIEVVVTERKPILPRVLTRLVPPKQITKERERVADEEAQTFDAKQSKTETQTNENSSQPKDVLSSRDGTNASAKTSELKSKQGGDKQAGPRVLGRIELPTRKPVRSESRGGTPSFADASSSEGEVDDEDSPRKSAKPKSKKREISRIDLVDYEGREPRRGPKQGGKQKGDLKKGNALESKTPARVSKRVVKLGESITVGDLARQMSLKAGEVISKLISLGVMATINQEIDKDTATILIEEFGFQMETTSIDEKQFMPEDKVDDADALVTRSPVVTVMGHVDHGKTSLLDRIRKASVAEKEAGGITQHIGAYRVTLPDGRSITFIDTPGHAAFTSMRARGAKVTDVVIIVVAADDGVMPQTIEGINHAKAAGVPIIVAVNKMDKPGANPDRAKQQLVEHGLQPEDWGGDIMFFPVSALKGDGIQELLEGVLLQAEVLELKANPARAAKGTIIEARQERGRGTVGTVLIQTGTLRVGDIFVAGAYAGKIRSMMDDKGARLEEAGPSWPVEITGLDGIPQAGDDVVVVESDAQARQIASLRAEKLAREERALATGPITLEEFARRAGSVESAELNVVLKADVHGSVEAVRGSLEQLSTEKVKVRVLHAAVGGVTESDVQLAMASEAIIVGFNVRAEPRAALEAEQKGVDLRFYRVIYELTDDIKNAMIGLLDPIKQEVFLGRAEVRNTFVIPKFGTIAGSYIVDGMVKRGSFARVLRDSKVIYEGKMSSLRRFKDDVREVQRGYECGIGVENFNDVKVGDVIEIFEQEEIRPTL